MKKKRIIIILIITVISLAVAVFIGTGFTKNPNVQITSYTISEEGDKLTFTVGMPSSIAYVRGYKDVGGGVKPHYLDFYNTFGAIIDSWGAQFEYVLELDKDDSEIYFNREDGGYELVLKKDTDTGKWIQPHNITNSTNQNEITDTQQNVSNDNSNDKDMIVHTDPLDTTFVRVKDYVGNLKIDLTYATSNNFTGHKIYDFDDVYLRFGTVKKIQKVSDGLYKQGYGIKIWDGYRPMSAQRKLWDICPDPKYVSNPDKGNRTHIRGYAIDLTLYDLNTGDELAMPSSFDDFTLKADRDYTDCSEISATNSKLLEQIMIKHGFTPYKAEWWHYTDSEVYDLEEEFNPSNNTIYYADCNEYITLRKQPNSSSEQICKISKDEQVIFLGYDNGFAYIDYNGNTGYVNFNYLKLEIINN